MKKTLMILLSLSMSYFIMAQEKEKQKEIGLVFSNLNNFGLTYKSGTDQSLWRFNTLFISGKNMEQTEDSSVYNQNRMGFGIKFGKEYRKVIVENLELRYGADISFTYSHSKTDKDDKSVNDYDWQREQTIYSPGINLVLGLNYVINDNFVIGAEMLPNFTYVKEISETKNIYNSDEELESDNSGFNYGLSNSSVLLSLAYRF